MKKGNETKKRGRKAIPTTKLYKELQEAYSFFNEELFNSELPHCLITLQYRSKNAGGHFIPQCF